jgi:enoyl-CoA hydratase/carnithine racemase
MYTSMKVQKDSGIARVIIDNPPLNLLDAALLSDLDAFITEVGNDATTKVIVFESADPDYFVAHGDMDFVDDPVTAAAAVEIAGDQALNPMLRLHERLRQLPQITIGKIAGVARGGGSELLLAMDMRFAAIETAGIAQNEAPIGLIPGGGGTIYLPRLVGRPRALEIILGARLFDAVTAEKYGWINRALPAAELDEFVELLARRIATLAPGVVSGTVEVVDASLSSHEDGLKVEDGVLFGLFARPAALALTHAARAAGAQTRDGERDLEALLDAITADDVDL